jgi:cobalt/nickel transport system permease protein
MFAVLLAPGHPARGSLGVGGVALALLLRNSLAIGAVLLLAAAVPVPRLLDALARLGMPGPIVTTLHFMQRYVHVLGEELQRMAQARQARNFRRSGRLDWLWLTGMIGALLLRSLERGDRVHAAMLARGWDGTFRSLDGPEA